MSNPFQDAPRFKKMMTLFSIYLGAVSMIIVSSGMATLLPAAATEIGGADYYPLATTIGGVIGIAAMPMFGYFGAKRPDLRTPFIAMSMTITAVVLFVYGIAPNMMVIVGISLFYGFITVGIYALGYPVIRDIFGQEQSGVYLGAIGTVMGIGMLIGPVGVGLVIDNFGWRAVCHIIWPLLVIAALLAFFGVRVSREDAEPYKSASGSFDGLGAFAMCLMLFGFVISLSLGSSLIPFGSIPNYILIALAVVGLVALVVIVRKKGAAAIIPSTVLKDRNTLVFTVSNFFGSFAGLPIFFFLPMFMLYVLQASATEAGLAILLYSIINLPLSPILGRMIAKAGTAKPVLIVGTILRIIITALFVILLVPGVAIWVIYVLAFVSGIYSSVQSVVYSVGPQIQLAENLRMQGNSVIQVAQNLGSIAARTLCTLAMAGLGAAMGTTAAFAMALAAGVIQLILAFFLKKPEPASPSEPAAEQAAG
jgi:MFS family permease